MKVEINLIREEKKTTNPMHFVLFMSLFIALLVGFMSWYQYNNVMVDISPQYGLSDDVGIDTIGSDRYMLFKDIIYSVGHFEQIKTYDATTDRLVQLNINYMSTDEQEEALESYDRLHYVESVKVNDEAVYDNDVINTSVTIELKAGDVDVE